MPGHVDVANLRLTLRDSNAIAKNGFDSLRQISTLVSEECEDPISVEMVLRALEHRETFGALAGILDALARRVGLFPFIDPSRLSARDLVAYEFHRPVKYDEDIVFHRVQAQIYRSLMAGDNVILSAPTSFGKSKIIDAMVAADKFDNIAVIVPTLALIDETRRRLSRFSGKYKVVTHLSQTPSKRNLFVLTAERAVAFHNLPRMDFFVIDEFYKLGMHDDTDRMVALNEVFYKLKKGKGQFYLLGPNVDRIPKDAEGTLNARWIQTDFHTVVSEVERVAPDDAGLAGLVRLCGTLEDPTIVYCASPKSVNQVVSALLAAGVGKMTQELKGAADWASEHFHSEWVFVKALLGGIGMHHGRLPRSLGQMVVRRFNDELLRFLVCTSTLIEGVNTRAKNVVVFDNKVARRKVDYFTFNNIKGRAGRMFQHFVGHVYVFKEPPERDLPFVDLPIVTQNEKTPMSLLVQLAPQDLTSQAAKRLQPILSQKELPLGVLRQNSAIDPEAQIALAEAIAQMNPSDAQSLAWSGFPKHTQLVRACELLWKYLVPQERHIGVFSGAQLAVKLQQLRTVPSVSERILNELVGSYRAKTVDEAVERVLGFDRNWASFEFPRYLMALSRIQEHVLGRRQLKAGNYSFYSSQVESLFQPPVLGALDEFGIPHQIGTKLLPVLGTEDDLDIALERLRKSELKGVPFTNFERALVEEAISGL